MIEVTSVRDWQAKVESFQTRQSDVTPGHDPLAFVVISGRKNLRRDTARIVVKPEADVKRCSDLASPRQWHGKYAIWNAAASGQRPSRNYQEASR